MKLEQKNAPTATNEQLLIVDGAAADLHQLAVGALIPYCKLQATEDPISAISRILQQRRQAGQPIRELHLMAHGSAEGMWVGNQRIHPAAVLQHSGQLASWGIEALYLWSCKLGQNQSLIDLFSEHSGANVFSNPEILNKANNWLQNSSDRRVALSSYIDKQTLKSWAGSLNDGLNNDEAASTRGVDQIFSNTFAFAALKDGQVITWGHESYGGTIPEERKDKLSSGVDQIFSTGSAFAALKDGAVITWGRESYGGTIPDNLQDDLSSGVDQIFSTARAFAALKDGAVFTWGDESKGGTIPDNLKDDLSSGVDQIFSTYRAFAALKDGEVFTWGDESRGSTIPEEKKDKLSYGVDQIFSTYRAFAALK
ncbi:MAG: DUF4347 domain-containing protein, partial [Prochlorococcus sp.]